MTKFRNTFLGLIDRAAEHSKQIVESLDKAASDFNFGDINKEFETRFGSLLSSGREFLNKIDEAARFARDTNKPFVVTLELHEVRSTSILSRAMSSRLKSATTARLRQVDARRWLRCLRATTCHA